MQIFSKNISMAASASKSLIKNFRKLPEALENCYDDEVLQENASDEAIF